MELSSLDPPLLGADLSKSFSAAPRTCSHSGAMDLVKQPEWYHRHQLGCGPETSSPFGCRSSSSYLSSRLHPEQAPVPCRNVEQQLFHRVQGRRWLQGCYGPGRTSSPPPESSGRDESDSDSDVIFLVSSRDEALLCSPFLQDSVGHMVAPLSPAASSLDEGQRCCQRAAPLSSPSPDSSYSEESSDSSLDVLLHRARPVVLLSELSAVYQSHAPFSLQVSSDDSDVIEVSLAPQNVDGGGRLSRSRDSAPQSDEDKAPPTVVRHSSRVRSAVTETPPCVCRTSRLRLQRRAKNKAVGIYYESCESEDVLGFASGSDADEPLAPPETDRKSPQTASEAQREGSKPVSRGQSAQLTNQTEGGKTGGDQRQQRVAPERRRNQETGSRTPRRRWRKKRRLQVGASAGFCAREPELRLRYAQVKEEKKRKAGGFCPFVHVGERTCVIVNFREDEDSVRSSPGAGRSGPPSVPGFVPTTSCFQPCRCSTDGGRQAALLCCLCGQTANAMGLGDLHGPYRPASPSRTRQNQKAWADGDAVCKASMEEGACASPPKAPPELWVHEDCGIWAAGVFLVRGRLYGLEEAARLAQETVCSVCRQAGAIMGCFLKSCSKSFHYRCAIQSGCVLNEDNFSVRCSEHKSKLWMSRRRKR